MKNSLKKKFLDILFEDDDTYGKKKVVVEEPENEPVVVKKSNKDGVNAKDVLYQKPSSSAFIDLDEKPKNQETLNERPKKDYEFTSQISPMFGVVGERKRSFKEVREKDDSITNKPENSHLEIITSPIYGYGPQDESNYIPSETNFLPFDEEEDYPYSHDEEFNNLMDYVENEDEVHDDEDEMYEELQEEENQHEEYMGYYQSNYLDDVVNEENEDENRDIPYYDSDVFNDDVEEISLFDVEEDE